MHLHVPVDACIYYCGMGVVEYGRHLEKNIAAMEAPVYKPMVAFSPLMVGAGIGSARTGDPVISIAVKYRVFSIYMLLPARLLASLDFV